MTKKRDKPLYLDMSLDEALKRFAQTDPSELPKPKVTVAAKRKKATKKRSVVRPVPQGVEKGSD
jgi:hypothetical protein